MKKAFGTNWRRSEHAWPMNGQYLAYVRTALALAAAGALLMHFFPDFPSLFGMAWMLFTAGAATFGVGLFRFLRVARRLRGNIT